jgi:CheY-like chemotaxis protein
MPQHAAIRVLIIEDEDADTQKAITIFHRLGLEIQSKITVWAARNLLEEIAEGEHSAPDLMVLDLGFPNESGFEVLRYWKSTPALAQIPIIVWTQAGELDRYIANLFKVSIVVQKSYGLEELEKELKRVIAGLT